MIALRTARLVLDAPRESDIDAVFEACQDAGIRTSIPLPDPYTRESAEFFVRSYAPHGLASGTFTVWALRRGDGEPLLGVVELRKDEAAGSASVGCWLAPAARGNGYMSEALRGVCRHALDGGGLGFDRLRWESLDGNAAGLMVARAVGFQFDGAAAHEVNFRGERRRAVVGRLESVAGVRRG